MKIRIDLLAFLTGVMVAWSSVYALAPIAPETKKLYSRAGKILSYELPYNHLTHQPFGDKIATNALTIFLNNLDYDRTIFLASDVVALQKEGSSLDDHLKKGNIDMPFKVYELFMQRLSNRVDYVRVLLTNSFDMTLDEAYDLDRKEAEWPANEAEWNELWRKKIKNRYVGKKVAEQLAEEKKAEEATNTVTAISSSNTVDTADLFIPPPASTNLEETVAISSNAVPPKKKLTPEESINKEFTQFMSVMQDNDADWLVPLYLSAFTRAYDPHSDYMSKNNKEDFDIHMKLSLVGIGALLSTEDGAAKVVRLIPGGPAEKDGRLKAGDKIIAVGQGNEEAVDTLHWPLSKTVRLIRGEKNTRVVLHIIPESDISGTTVNEIDIIRDEVKLEEGAAKGRVETVIGSDEKEYTLGLITVPDFYSDMYAAQGKKSRSLTKDVHNIIEGMLASNTIEGLILDLRNNGGGSLPEAIELSGLFIRSGPVVQVKASGQDEPSVYRDTDTTIDYEGPLLVLVSRQSASASEIFAGALQDYGRAIIVGDSKTHGKGTVQSLFPLRRYNSKLGSLKLTTATFYRIAGGSTQKKGITPDIVIPSLYDSMEIGEEFLPNALEWSVVDPAFYRTTDAWSKMVPSLTLDSEERREAEPRFQSYKTLLEYLTKQRQSKSVPLQYEKRMEMIRHEKEMADYIAKEMPRESSSAGSEDEDGDTTEEEKEENDLILEEALNILIDMIELRATGNDLPTKTAGNS